MDPITIGIAIAGAKKLVETCSDIKDLSAMRDWQSIVAIIITFMAIVMAVFSMSIPANAQAICGDTMSHQQFVSQMITTVPNLNVVTMDAEQQDSYVSALNALPPKTNYQPHKVYIYQAPQHPDMLVEMVDIQGCMMSIEKIQPDTLFEMMGVTKQLQGV